MTLPPGASRALSAVFAGLLLAGCTAPRPPGVAGPPEQGGSFASVSPGEDFSPSPRAPVVVALPDSGINPYHHAFRAPIHVHPSQWLHGFPPDAEALHLTLTASTYEEALAADAEVWADVERGKLYWIPGTRIVGAISFGELRDEEEPRPVLDDFLHGTAVAGAVLDAAPEALLVVVETYPLLWDAYDWVNQQPWIDMVSISIGPIGNLPVERVPASLVENTIERSRVATERGMLVVAAAGNTPTLSATGVAGPPWVVSVGGARSDQHGEVVVASKAVDVVSEYAMDTLSHNTTGQRVWRSGTSFAAPLVAGTLAHAVGLLRAEAGQHAGRAGGALVQGLAGHPDGVTNADLREAMNRTAAYWTPTKWAPRPPGATPTQTWSFLAEALAASAPVGPAPWLQMGWGYLGPGHGPAIAEAARGGAPDKPEAAQAHMAATQAARCAMWCQP